MERIVRDIARIHSGNRLTSEEWKSATRLGFAPFVRRKGMIIRYEEVLVTEIVTLSKLASTPIYVSLLEKTIIGFRVALNKNRKATLKLVSERLSENTRTETAFISLSQNLEHPTRDQPPRDQAFRIFNLLDAVLEGCFKPRFVSVFSLSKLVVAGLIPANADTLDFGKQIQDFPSILQPDFSLYLQDPIMGIATNQWRNIAAHKNYRLISSSQIEIVYGKNKKHSAILTIDRLWEVFKWAFYSYYALRMAETIVFLEYMDEIKAIGPVAGELGLESRLVGITHKINIMGFEVIEIVEKGCELAASLAVRTATEISDVEACCYITQLLAPLAHAICNDVTRNGQIECVSTSLIKNGDALFKASVSVTDAQAYLREAIAFEDYEKRIDMEFYEGLEL